MEVTLKRIRNSIATAGFAAILAVGTASAQAQITNVVVSGARDGATAQPVLPINTTSVWVTFEYQRAGTSDISVKVVTAGGTVVFFSEDSYTGGGTASVEVTGADIYASIMSSLVDLGEAAQGALAKIASQQQIRQYAQDTANYVGQMEVLESLVSSAEYPGLDQQNLASLSSALDSLGDLIVEMGEASEDDAKRAKAAEMEPHVAAAVAAIDALDGATGSDFAIPPSPAATGEAAYLVQIEVDGFLSKSTDFWIWGDTGSEVAPGGAGTTPPEGGVVGGPAPAATRTPPGSGSVEAGATDASGSGAAAPRQGSPLVVPAAGATATALSLAAAAEKASQLQEAPPEGMPIAQESGSAPLSDEIPSPTAGSYVVKGNVVEAPGGAAGAAGESTSQLPDEGPNFALLLVGVVVLAGVAVFMKGRM
jgi:hypothetical protein